MNRLREWVGSVAWNMLRRLVGLPEARHVATLTAAVKPFPKEEGDVRLLLHVGCGPATLASIPLTGFHNSNWEEVRLDADESVNPDIVGSMVKMDSVADGFADAIFSSHNVEHLFPHEVLPALFEFRRVLKPNGFVVIACPDLQAVCARVAQGQLHETAYESPVGPIAAIDILYGHRSSLADGNHFMAHRTGFTFDSLIHVLNEAGFENVYGFRRPEAFDLWVLASKSPRTTEEMAALAEEYLIPKKQNQGE